MKISRVVSMPCRLPADEPLAGGPVSSDLTRDFVTVRVQTDAGVEGIGVTFFGGALTGTLKRAVDDLGALAIGEDPERVEAVCAKLRGATYAGCGPGGIAMLALAAIDQIRR